MARKSVDNEASVYHRNVLTIVAVLGLLVAALPAYWSYLCRSSGAFCEGSFASPSTGPEVRDKVAARISSEGGKKDFDGLSVRQAGVWPSPRRYDIVAQFKDGTETAIDSVELDGVTEVYFAQKDTIVALIGQTNDGSARITAYFPAANLAKRVFDLGSSWGTSEVKIRNFSYDGTSRTMTFDLESSSQWLTVNKNENIRFGIGKDSPIQKSFGATVSVELTDALHVENAYDRAIKVEFEASKKQVEECKNSAASKPNKIEGELFGCWMQQSDTLSHVNGRVLIYEWQNAELKLATSEPCNMCYFSKGSALKTIFVSRNEVRHAWADAGKQVETWLSVHRAPFDVERTYFIRGECEKFNPWEIDDIDRKTISFRLDTDCATVKINNRVLNFRETEQKGTEITEMFQLKIDDKETPVALVSIK